jgi:hypothetical protein
VNYRKILNYSLLLFVCAAVVLLVVGSSSHANAKPQDPPNSKVGCRGNNGQGKGQGKCPKEEYQDRKEAGARAFQEGMMNPLMVDVQAALAPGAVPHYFSHPNYANSPLPTVEGTPTFFGNTLLDRTYASDFPVGVGELAPVFVVVPTALPDGFLTSFQTWNQATPGASPFPSAGNVFHAYVLRPTGNPDEYTVVGETAKFGVANLTVQSGDVLGFYGQGIPVDTGAGSDVLSYPAPTPPLQDTVITLGSAEFPIFPQARTYSFGAEVLDLSNPIITGGIEKFVDGLPGLGAGAANNLGQFIPVAVPDTTTYPGSDYYIIELGEYTEQMHSDLPATTLRGYRQAGHRRPKRPPGAHPLPQHTAHRVGWQPVHSG